MAEKAAAGFDLDMTAVPNSRRVSSEDKDKRDMLIYFLWKTGKLSNQGIGSLLGLTYSNISRRVGLFKERLRTDKNLKSNYNHSKSQFKV